jgi:ribosome assembly protein 1
LKEQFAKIDIQVSAPIVPFRETIVDYSGRKPNECTIEWKSSNELVEMSIKCIPLPNKMVTYLGHIADDLKDILVDTSNRKNDGESGNDVDSKIASIEKQLAKLSDRTDLEGIMHKVAAFGPKRVGQNVLIINAYDRKFWLADKQSRNYEAAIQTGFQVFSQTGPLCAEPLQGVAVIIERLFVKEDDLTGNFNFFANLTF